MKSGNEKRKVKSEKSEWISFSKEKYLEASRGMVHFSAKVVNSKTPSLGIRFDRRKSRDLPYVAVSTLPGAVVPLDFSASASLSKVCKQISDAMYLDADRLNEKYESVPDADLDAIKECGAVLNEETIIEKEERIGIRLRQIIVQDCEGQDIALTPLPSSGLAEMIKDRLTAEREKDREENRAAWRSYSYMTVGGSNPQNVTLFAYALRNVLVFTPPGKASEASLIKRAFSVHFNGVKRLVDKKRLLNLIEWQEEVTDAHFLTMPSSLNWNEALSSKINAIVKDLLIRAEDARELVIAFSSRMPNSKPLSDEISWIQRALIIPSERTLAWRNAMADRILSEMLGTTVKRRNERVSIKREFVNHSLWLDKIMEAL